MITTTLNIALLLSVFLHSDDSIERKEQQEKPNILFIAVDDLKPILGCYGDSLIKTPNIDRLASLGTVFQNTYCQQAISGATRASLLTGLRPDKTQVYDLVTQIRDINPNVVTLPGYFKNEGYVTAAIGKIFHPTNVVKEDGKHSWSIPHTEAKEYLAEAYGYPALGFYQHPDTKWKVEKYRMEAKRKGLKDAEVTKYILSHIKPSIECVDVPDNAYADGAVTLKAKEQLQILTKAGKPFFLAVGYHKPHLPFVAPKKYWDLYDRQFIPIAKYQKHAKNSPEFAYHRCGELKKYTDIPEFCTFTDQSLHTGLDLEKQKELIHGYYACISYLDAQVGELLATLESLGTLDNTIIVLWGDHGWHLGDHDLWNKHTNFENATKVPLIMVAPGISSGDADTFAEFVDIYPTLCDLAGINIPLNIDGKSLVQAMENKKSRLRDYAVSQYPRKLTKEEADRRGYESTTIMGYSLRTERYRYTMWVHDFTTRQLFSDRKICEEELYDYQKDPLETINVVAEKSYFKIKKELKKMMIDFFSKQLDK